jgi:hypothetical protein
MMEHNHNFNLNLDKVKAHVRRNKRAYSVGTVVVIAGVAYYLGTRRTITQISVAPVFNNMINNTVNNGGHMRKIVRCLETNEIWLSVTEAALAQGKNLSLMSQHLNHPEVVPHINELHFVIEALATN